MGIVGLGNGREQRNRVIYQGRRKSWLDQGHEKNDEAQARQSTSLQLASKKMKWLEIDRVQESRDGMSKQSCVTLQFGASLFGQNLDSGAGFNSCFTRKTSLF
jgi:hypothetical protein